MKAMNLRTTGRQCVAFSSGRRHQTTTAKAASTQAPSKVSAAERVQLGDSDLQVSVCCLGTMTWGKQNTEEEAHAQLNYAFDMGINFLDTAEMYPVPPAGDTKGFTDLYIGRWLKDRKRDEVVVATKVSGYGDRSKWVRNTPQTTRVNRDQIVESVENSLARLQTDYVDLLQIHWPDRYVPLFGSGPYDIKQERQGDVPFEEQLRGLEEVVKAGKVRYIGVSNETSYGVAEFSHLAKQLGLPKIQSIQNVYSLLCRVAYETDLAETCRRYDVGLLAYSPLAGGALTGKYIDASPAKARFNFFPGYMERYNKSLAKEAVSLYDEVAKKHGLTLTQLALAFVKSRWFTASTIIGATSMDQLKENIDAFNVELTDDCLADINAIFKKYRDPAISG